MYIVWVGQDRAALGVPTQELKEQPLRLARKEGLVEPGAVQPAREKGHGRQTGAFHRA